MSTISSNYSTYQSMDKNYAPFIDSPPVPSPDSGIFHEDIDDYSRSSFIEMSPKLQNYQLIKTDLKSQSEEIRRVKNRLSAAKSRQKVNDQILCLEKEEEECDNTAAAMKFRVMLLEHEIVKMDAFSLKFAQQQQNQANF